MVLIQALIVSLFLATAKDLRAMDLEKKNAHEITSEAEKQLDTDPFAPFRITQQEKAPLDEFLKLYRQKFSKELMLIPATIPKKPAHLPAIIRRAKRRRNKTTQLNNN